MRIQFITRHNTLKSLYSHLLTRPVHGAAFCCSVVVGHHLYERLHRVGPATLRLSTGHPQCHPGAVLAAARATMSDGSRSCLSWCCHNGEGADMNVMLLMKTIKIFVCWHPAISVCSHQRAVYAGHFTTHSRRRHDAHTNLQTCAAIRDIVDRHARRAIAFASCSPTLPTWICSSPWAGRHSTTRWLRLFLLGGSSSSHVAITPLANSTGDTSRRRSRLPPISGATGADDSGRRHSCYRADVELTSCWSTCDRWSGRSGFCPR